MPAAAAVPLKAPPRPRLSVRDRLQPLAAALGSAVLLWLAFPPADQGQLAWPALVPLFVLVDDSRSPRSSLYVGAWLGGLAFWLLAIEWLRRIDPSAWLAWIALAAYLSLYWPAFLGIARLIRRRLKLPLTLVAPLVWVALEYVRSHLMTGFPWFNLAQSQYRALPLIQIADLTGVWGPSLLVALVNAVAAEAFVLYRNRSNSPGSSPSRKELRTVIGRWAIVSALLPATAAYGFIRLKTSRFSDGPTVTLLQSDFVQELKMSQTADQTLDVFYALIHRSLGAKPDLIVWPETSFPYAHTRIDPALNDAALARHEHDAGARLAPAEVRRRGKLVADSLHELTDSVAIPQVFGLSVIEYTPQEGRRKYNAALLMEPNTRQEQRYDKLHLVPFGEYVPLLETFPFLTRLTPYQGESVPRLTRGAGPRWFEIGRWKYATAICFEDTVPDVVRRFFAETPDQRPPDVLLNISNDGWFRGSSEIDTHLAASVFRAIENRVPLLRAVNTGGTAVIDGNGRILRSLPRNQAAALTATVPLDPRAGLYSIWGDWLAQAIVIATTLLIFTSLANYRLFQGGRVCQVDRGGVD